MPSLTAGYQDAVDVDKTACIAFPVIHEKIDISKNIESSVVLHMVRFHKDPPLKVN